MTTLPWWGVVLLGLAGPIVGVGALVVGWLIERARQEHERQSKLREERIRAYATFFSLARGARAARHRSQTLVTQPGEPTALEKLRDARATVELLRETPELEKHARALYAVCTRFLEEQETDESDAEKYRDARNAFVAWARYELGLASQTSP
jgi:hypothetical protein